MTWEIVCMLLILVLILVSFICEKIPTELTAMTGFSVVLVLGLLPASDALVIFSNAGPIAVGAMFILSAALEKCGAIDRVATGLNRLPSMGLRTLLPLMILSVAIISGFINNTPVVVVFLPVVLSMASKFNIPASKLLIPLSYASIFGGSCTLVGTSTNIIVSSISTNAGYEPLGMFELAVVGLPLLVVGTLYLTFIGPSILPIRESISSILSEEERREYMVEAFVTDNSPLVGKAIRETVLDKVSNLRVLEIMRHGIRLTGPMKETVLNPGDRLLLSLSPRAISQAHQAAGLDLRDLVGEGLEQISLTEGVIVEAVLGPGSGLIGRSIADINFRQRYRLVPMALHRMGVNLRRNFDKVPLNHGDTLLLLGSSEALEQTRGGEDLLILDRPPVILAAKRKKLPFVIIVIAGVIGAATFNLMPIAPAAIIGCTLLLLTGCISTKAAYESIHWPILFLIFSMLGLGMAMESTGTSAFLADKLILIVSTLFSESWRPLALLAGIYLLTTLLTEILSNNASAVLLSTLAIGIAETLSIDPRPFLVAIAIGASASFATPIGYQTNTYVYGVGGYRFFDFIKIGVPLNILAFIISMIVIPMFWEF